jgi:hypothetical protein
MNRILLTFLIISTLSGSALCQEQTKSDTSLSINEYTPLWESDTVALIEDSIYQYQQAPLVQGDTMVVDPDLNHSPSKALMYALVLPGLGQAYNRKYYKIPIVWLAMGGAAYAISFNSKQYQRASEEYALNPEDDRELLYWRRYVELSYIAMIAAYALQVLDAYVDAQLYSWEVNDNLSMRVAPSLQPLLTSNNGMRATYGLTCSFQLKRK